MVIRRNSVVIGFTLAALLFMLPGCSHKQPAKQLEENVNTPETNAPEANAPEANAPEKQASNCTTPEEIAACLRNGEIERVYQQFDAQMQELMSLEALKATMAQLYGILGEFVSYQRTGQAELQGFMVYDVVDKYERQTLVMRISFDKDHKINGLSFKFGEENAFPTPGADGEVAKIDSIKPNDGPVSTDKYSETEVQVQAAGGPTLDAFLTLPKGVEKPPVVILVHGSGPHDKNETILGAAPFKDIAYGLGERGIATLRYTKRTASPNWKPADINRFGIREETIDDANAAIALLRTRTDINTEKIFVLGHSLGGMIVPVIAKENPTLSGVISVAGTPRDILDVQIEQNVRTLEETKATASPEELKEAEAQIKQLQDMIDGAIASTKDLDKVADETPIFGVPAYYYKSLRKHQDKSYYTELRMPILLLQGENDMQVYADKDFTAYKEILKDNPKMVSHLYPKTNHLMTESTNTKVSTIFEDYTPTKHVRTEVIDDIAAFIKAN
ncbi:MAG: DUF3887 domain-containing protein [Proteobacteria bacterium]|nr:DUF3887 domain-containing protein [Pseudomonadota bacterium]